MAFRVPLFVRLALGLVALPLFGQTDSQSQSGAPPPVPAPARSGAKTAPPARPPTAEEELQAALNDAGNDRVALVRNLEGFLAKYPDYPNRSGIYRAIVEASVQLRDNARAADYAERMVALNPNDVSTLLLAIELLERQENEPALRRAVNYSTRVLDAIRQTPASERSRRVSAEQWERQKKNDLANTYFLRGDLYFQLKDYVSAKKDLQISYDTQPSAGAAQRLGEVAELQKDLNTAIVEYARAFALAEGSSGGTSRLELRKKIGNVWRLAHGSERGLGEYLLGTYDEVARPARASSTKRNEDAHEFCAFTLGKAPDGEPFPLEDTKGKVVVMNFWATWCGPCHALEPLYARVASKFHGLPGVLFLSVDGDEDETLVGPYLQKAKLPTEVVFADGLERLFSVVSFPTVIVLDRDGKIAFRVDGFQPETFERDLFAAIQRASATPQAK